MIKFKVRIFFVEMFGKPTEFNLDVNAESPVEAALKAFEREDEHKPRENRPSDCCIVLNPQAAYTGYFVLDLNNHMVEFDEDSFYERLNNPSAWTRRLFLSDHNWKGSQHDKGSQ